MRVPYPSLSFTASLLCGTLLLACNDDQATGPSGAGNRVTAAPPTPGQLVTFEADGPMTIWPFVSHDLASPDDPVNIILVGDTDPVKVRAALMSLDGDRTALGLPGTTPFDCRWLDAMGGLQGAYDSNAGWSGSVIQLECGQYQGLRFHLRLFQAGARTIASAHFETIIPATTEHQVLSWELAEQLVVADFLRTGLAQPVGTTGAINPSPWREIPVEIYNLLPPELAALIGGPPAPASQPVGIASDGSATVLGLSQLPEATNDSRSYILTVMFDQVIPKPFCSDPYPLVQVQGPVDLRKEVVAGPGFYRSSFEAQGSLRIVPFDPNSGPVAAGYQAQVRESQSTSLAALRVVGLVTQVEFPAAAGRGSFRAQLAMNSGTPPAYQESSTCH